VSELFSARPLRFHDSGNCPLVTRLNGLGQFVTDHQSHSGAADVNPTPKVQHACQETSGGANHSRLTSMTYPAGFVANDNYRSGLNDKIARLSTNKKL
jgi:hypothetical protein